MFIDCHQKKKIPLFQTEPFVTLPCEGNKTVQWEQGYEEWKQEYFSFVSYASARSICHGKKVSFNAEDLENGTILLHI